MSGQVQQIIDLRGEEASYGEIAASLGISRNTVKSVCRRNKITKQLETSAVECSWCKAGFD